MPLCGAPDAVGCVRLPMPATSALPDGTVEVANRVTFARVTDASISLPTSITNAIAVLDFDDDGDVRAKPAPLPLLAAYVTLLSLVSTLVIAA